MEITIAKLSEGTSTIKVKKGATLNDALEQAGYSAEDVLADTRVNNLPLQGSYKLKEDDFVIVSPKVRGGK